MEFNSHLNCHLDHHWNPSSNTDHQPFNSWTMMGSSSNNNGTPSSGANGSHGTTNQNKYPGITSPISVSMPKDVDFKLSNKLEDCLRSFNLFESDDEMNHRMQVLSQINELVQKWVQEVSLTKKMPPETATQMNGKIFTFGSFRLGVHTKGINQWLIISILINLTVYRSGHWHPSRCTETHR